MEKSNRSSSTNSTTKSSSSTSTTTKSSSANSTTKSHRRKSSAKSPRSRGSAKKGKKRDKITVSSKYGLSDLPREVLLSILNYLPHFPELIAVAKTNSRLRSVAQDPLLWRRLPLENYGGYVSDRLIVWIAALNPSLEALSLRGCTEVSDIGLTACLGRCHQLKELYLDDLERQFSLTCLDLIGKLCPQLETLVLPGIFDGNPDSVIIPIIENCRNLKTFKSFSQFTHLTLKCLADRCKKLRKLRLGTTTKPTRVTQSMVEQLVRSRKLESIELGYFTLDVADWGKISNGNLRSFRAFGWLNLTPPALCAMLKHAPKLEVLHLIHSISEDELAAAVAAGTPADEATFNFEYLSSFCPMLKNVNMCDTPITEADIQVLITCCPSLQQLRVGRKSTPGNRYEIGDTWMAQVINECPHLEVLKVYHANIRTETLAKLTLGCPKLRELTLGWCNKIAWEGLGAIGRSGEREKYAKRYRMAVHPLQKLSLRNTQIESTTLQLLMRQFPRVKSLTLIETGASDVTIGYVVGKYGALQSLKLEPRKKLTTSGEIIYRGRHSKKRTLTEQERVFLTIFRLKNTRRNWL